MNRAEWMAALAPLIRPRAPAAAATQLGKMLPFLTDVPDDVFTADSLARIAPLLKRSPSFAEVRGALQGYSRSLNAPAEPQHSWDAGEQRALDERTRLATREAALQDEWDNPDGIRERIRTCGGELRFLRLLAGLVFRWAPQHLGLLPPHAIAALDDDTPDARPMPPGRGPRYLTAEQLQIAKGSKHAQASAVSPPANDASAAHLDPDPPAAA